MKPSTLVAALACIALSASVLRAQDRAQVGAATASAVANLRRQIDPLPLGRGLTVGQFISKTQRGDEMLTQTLQRAEMVGGPRWLDDQTVEVRLDIAGTKISAVLTQIAASITSKPYGAPYTPEYVARESRAWESRTFSATGTATGPGGVIRVRPPEGDVHWAPVPDAVRQQAIDAARANADATVFAAIDPLRAPGGAPVAGLRANADVNAALTHYLDSRPVRAVEFTPNQQVRITVAMRGEDLADALRVAAVAAHLTPDDPNAWQPLRDTFARTVTDPTGLAIAGGGAPPPGSTQVVEVQSVVSFPTDRPPQWVFQQMDVKGFARPASSQLRTARAAERDARQKLRAQLEALPLAQDLTVGAAARTDPRVRDAVDHTLDRAHTYKVDYKEDGSAEVSVSVEPAGLWAEMTQGR